MKYYVIVILMALAMTLSGCQGYKSPKYDVTVNTDVKGHHNDTRGGSSRITQEDVSDTFEDVAPVINNVVDKYGKVVDIAEEITQGGRVSREGTDITGGLQPPTVDDVILDGALNE